MAKYITTIGTVKHTIKHNTVSILTTPPPPPPLEHLAHKMRELLLKKKQILLGSIIYSPSLPLDEMLGDSPILKLVRPSLKNSY